ncbi:MAG: hypothetical protein IPN19_14660 [Elusimicrobia bacterium]|nr:hypothetical protein [Elusimicrobiota bacterium]
MPDDLGFKNGRPLRSDEVQVSYGPARNRSTSDPLTSPNLINAGAQAKKLTPKNEIPSDYAKFSIQDTRKGQPITWNNLNKSLVTNKNEAYFWSGRTNGIGGEALASKIAQSRGGTTLEGLLKSKGIKMPGSDHPMSKAAWEEVSLIYANNVSGKVRVVLGQEVREGSVWRKIEFDTLKANPKVKEIVAIDPETHIESLLFSR